MSKGNDVSESVFSIVAAFTSGFDVLKKVREKRRRRKTARKAEPSGDELQLSKSLRRGPVDIQRHYERRYADAGEKFARGDPIAHASLTEILLKLNTGLVALISSFLCHGKHDSTRLDYKSLTDLSDKSRLEAIDALGQLYQRLSQSQLVLNKIRPKCSRCGSFNHASCGSSTDLRLSDRQAQQGEPRRKKTTRSKATSDNATVARLPSMTGSQSKLVMMRPRNTRKNSSSSYSSSAASKSRSNLSTATPTPVASPLASPSLDKLPPPPRQKTRPPEHRKPVRAATAPPAKPSTQHRPDTWPHAGPRTANLPLVKPQPFQAHPERGIHPEWPSCVPAPRRADKLTPSVFSFASDSTKLGEIPMRKWTIPFDYEAAERLNAEAAARGYVTAPPPLHPDVKDKKKGLFRFLKKS